MLEQVTVMKQGEQSFQASLGRGPSNKGLILEVHTYPDVEDFMRTLGAGQTVEVRSMGRHWEPLEKGTRLLVYALHKDMGSMIAEDGSTFRLDRVGYPILDDMEGGTPYVTNLSFLRLVGTSTGGVTLKFPEVHSADEIRQMAAKIGAAYKQFYAAYIKPFKIAITVSTQELPQR